MSVEPHPMETKEPPRLTFTFECSKQDRLQAFEAGLSYRIGRRKYRWLGILLGAVFAYPALSSPISGMTALFLAVSIVIISVLVVWPLYMRLKVVSETSDMSNLTIEINTAVVVCLSGNEELIRYPWLLFSGIMHNRHGIALLFGTKPSVVWLPTRVFDDSFHAKMVERFIRNSADRFRSVLEAPAKTGQS